LLKKFNKTSMDCRIGEQIKPLACTAFVVMEKIKQQLKPMQQQPEQLRL
jgi:hypothetical protein